MTGKLCSGIVVNYRVEYAITITKNNVTESAGC